MSASKKVVDSAENPRIPLSTSPDHYCITAGCFQHSFYVLRLINITVAYDRYGYGLFYSSNRIPIRLPTVKLLPRSTMHGHGSRSLSFRNQGKLNRINVPVIPALADFYGDRLFRHRNNGFNQFTGKLRFQHKCAALPVLCNFRGRTAHIDINNGGFGCIQLLHRMGKYIRL